LSDKGLETVREHVTNTTPTYRGKTVILRRVRIKDGDAMPEEYVALKPEMVKVRPDYIEYWFRIQSFGRVQ
jgi:hypothetical protein